MTHPIPVYETQEFAPKATRYCVVVMVWNEGDRIKSQLGRMKPNAALADIIMADGGSDDGSMDPNFLKSCGVRTLLVTKERGLCTAIRMGMAYAMDQGYEAVITLDGNGKDGVEALPDFLEKLDTGYDLVQGSRFMKGGHHTNTPMERYIGVRYVIAPFIALGGFWYTDPTNAFRAMSMRFLRDPRVIPLRPEFVRFNLQHYLNYRAAQLKFKVTEIPVSRVYPEDGSVPTKIVGWGTKWLLLKELFLTVLGRYNPK
jgi:glycosyltransferase involved in cell wall biosynthesis